MKYFITTSHLTLDQTGRVVLSDDDLNHFEEELRVLTAGATPTANTYCNGSSNSTCNNTWCDRSMNTICSNGSGSGATNRTRCMNMRDEG